MKTDAQLRHDVFAELKWESSISALLIDVKVNEGVVTLLGQVRSYAEKWDAERIARRVTGVKAVEVSLDVSLPIAHKRTDRNIAESIRNILCWIPSLPKNGVRIAVVDGWATLSGQVDWDYQKQILLAEVRCVMGMRGLSDQITLKPRPTFKSKARALRSSEVAATEAASYRLSMD